VSAIAVKAAAHSCYVYEHPDAQLHEHDSTLYMLRSWAAFVVSSLMISLFPNLISQLLHM
jgi:hypothetical protein